MKNKILFTGSSGKVGRLIIPFLIGSGYEIEYYDILETLRLNEISSEIFLDPKKNMSKQFISILYIN